MKAWMAELAFILLLAALVHLKAGAALPAIIEVLASVAAALLAWRGSSLGALVCVSLALVAAALLGMWWALAPLAAAVPAMLLAKGERRFSVAVVGVSLSLFSLIMAGLSSGTAWEISVYVAAFSLFSSLAVAAGLVPAIEGQGT